MILSAAASVGITCILAIGYSLLAALESFDRLGVLNKRRQKYIEAHQKKQK